MSPSLGEALRANALIREGHFRHTETLVIAPLCAFEEAAGADWTLCILSRLALNWSFGRALDTDQKKGRFPSTEALVIAPPDA